MVTWETETFIGVECIEKAMVRGGPADFAVVGLRVTLYDGKFHSVDSSEAALETAGSMGLQALDGSGTKVQEKTVTTPKHPSAEAQKGACKTSHLPWW